MDSHLAVVLHGVLMWVGMGLCMPVGVILVRFLRAARQQAGDTRTLLGARNIAKSHIVALSIGVLITLISEIVLFLQFGTEKGLAHTHGRLGVALLVAPLLAVLLGVVRPKVGTAWKRGLWYAAHWTLGTGTVILGIINIFIGMYVFEIVTGQSLRFLNGAFAVQVALMALVYLAQDRWAYLRLVQWAPTSSAPLSDPSSTEKNQVQELAIAVKQASELEATPRGIL